MSRIALAYVGMINGERAYTGLGAEDIRNINGQEILVVDMKSGKSKRSGLQNSAIHLYLGNLAKALNDAGWDMVAVLKVLSANVKIPWSMQAAKERLWAVVQKNTYDTDSTTKLDTDQVSVVYEALNQVTSEKLGVGVQFPDKFLKMYEEDLRCGR